MLCDTHTKRPPPVRIHLYLARPPRNDARPRAPPNQILALLRHRHARARNVNTNGDRERREIEDQHRCSCITAIIAATTNSFAKCGVHRSRNPYSALPLLRPPQRPPQHRNIQYPPRSPGSQMRVRRFQRRSNRWGRPRPLAKATIRPLIPRGRRPKAWVRRRAIRRTHAHNVVRPEQRRHRRFLTRDRRVPPRVRLRAHSTPAGPPREDIYGRF